MKRYFARTIIALILITSAVSAQMADQVELNSIKKDYLGLEPASNTFGLIDLSRLHWSHSYSFAYYSGAGYSGSVGMYTGNILYEFSPKLSMNFKLGVAHNPGALVDRTASSDAVFLPGLTLDYHPSSSFRITAGFDTYYGPGNYYSPFYNGWRWR